MTASGKMYLKAVYYLSSSGAVRTTDIAEALGVSRPSVSNALIRLAHEGLLTHQPYGDIRMTPEGYRLAQGLAAADERLRKMGTLCALQYRRGKEGLSGNGHRRGDRQRLYQVQELSARVILAAQ